MADQTIENEYLEDSSVWSFTEEQIEYLQQFWKNSSDKEKLRFLFDLCDLNCNMLVEKSELSTVLHAVFEYCGVDDKAHLEEIDGIVKEIFEHKDLNKDNLLTEEEFIKSDEIDVKLFQKFEQLVDFKH